MAARCLSSKSSVVPFLYPSVSRGSGTARTQAAALEGAKLGVPFAIPRRFGRRGSRDASDDGAL
jgi:hypothetical protein